MDALGGVDKMSKAYWWCENCQIEVDPRSVTYEEFHDCCGHPVRAIELQEVDEIARLRADVERLKVFERRFQGISEHWGKQLKLGTMETLLNGGTRGAVNLAELVCAWDNEQKRATQAEAQLSHANDMLLESARARKEAEAQLAVAVRGLKQIANGNMLGMISMALSSNWHGIVIAFQKIACATISALPDHTQKLLDVVEAADNLDTYEDFGQPADDLPPECNAARKRLYDALAALRGKDGQ